MNEEQEPEFVRTDGLQRLNARKRLQGRMNIRAAAMPAPVQAYVYGLGLLALTPSSPPSGLISGEDGGVVLVSITTLKNWSSNGNDTAPIVGPWLYLEQIVTTETVDGETAEGDEAFPSVTQDVVHWEISYWEDGVKDPGFAWSSEILHADLAEDLFIFRTWNPVPDDEDIQESVWVQPLPPIITITDVSGLTAALAAKLEVGAISFISDSSMLALGFNSQMECSLGGSIFYLPISDVPWL